MKGWTYVKAAKINTPYGQKDNYRLRNLNHLTPHRKGFFITKTQRKIMNYQFRGLEAYGVDWIYGFVVRFQNDDSSFVYYIQEDTTVHIQNVRQTMWEVKPDTTGLASSRKDRNGKTVFQGDVLQRFKKNGQPYQKTKLVKYHGDRWENLDFAEESEIVGDIYTKPNLLLKIK